MSYFRKNGVPLTLGDDLGGASCRTGAASWHDNAWWVPVKDANGKAYELMQTDAILALPMCKTGASSGGGLFDLLGKVVGAAGDVLKAKVTPGQTTVIQGGGGGGMSTTSKVALAGAAALGLVLVLRARKRK